MASTNGTFVNGTRLGANERQLKARDIVQFGKLAIIVELNEDECAVPKEEQTNVGVTNPHSWEDTITTLAQAIELRDEYTGVHSQRVTNFSLLLGRHLHLSAEEIELIRFATPLHDLGKIGIDDAILRKLAALTVEEYRMMQTHTVKGDAIISTIPELHMIRPIVRSHHERWDGKGYPDGLVGEQIPLLARIVAVADAFDAMAFDTPYRQAMPPDVAFTEIRKLAGQQFDPNCATAFMDIQEKIVSNRNIS